MGRLLLGRTVSYDFLFWLSLALKLILTAGIVVSASVIVERTGPFIGSLVVTLPVTVWPAYVFLSVDHNAAYVAATAQSGLAVNAVSSIFMLTYLVMAQRHGVIASLAVAVGCWILLASLVIAIKWSIAAATLLNLTGYSACLWASRRYREVCVSRTTRQWYELPLRTILVCALMGAVLGMSYWAGPQATGMLAVYPISTTCTMLILHTRVGGQASAAVIANGLWGLLGIGGGLLALSLTIESFGTSVALTLALIIPVTWNLSVWMARHLNRRSERGPTPAR